MIRFKRAALILALAGMAFPLAAAKASMAGKLIEEAFRSADPRKAYEGLLSPTVKSSDLEAWYRRKAKKLKESDQRAMVVAVIMHKQDPSSAAFIKERLESDADPSVREMAAMQWQYPAFREALEPSLRAKVEDGKEVINVRLRSALTLAEWGDLRGLPLAMKTLLEASKPEHVTGQLLSSGFLQKFGRREDIKPLERADKESENVWTRMYSAKAAFGIRTRLARDDAAKLDVLAEAAAHPTMEVREWAFGELMQGKIPGTMAMLEKIKADKKHPAQDNAAMTWNMLRNREEREAAQKKEGSKRP